MDDLVEWLRACLTEDEQVARACPGDGAWTAEDIGIYGADLSPEVRAHMAVHDPARVLREIAAKRDLLRFAEGIRDHHETFTAGVAARLEETLRLFALAYADRPGYREEWRP
jgi:hypothetical protein